MHIDINFEISGWDDMIGGGEEEMLHHRGMRVKGGNGGLEAAWRE